MRSDSYKEERNFQQKKYVVLVLIALEGIELLDATIDAPVENKLPGL